MKVEFIKRPGPYNLAYFPGEVGEFNPHFAKELVEQGYARYTEEAREEKEIELAIQDIQRETAAIEYKKRGRPAKNG